MTRAPYKALLAPLLPLTLTLGIMPTSLAASATRLKVDSTIGELLDNPAAKQVLLRHIEACVRAPQVGQARGLCLRSVRKYAPERACPTPLEDCHSAFAWMLLHAEELQIDPARIAFGGASARGVPGAYHGFDISAPRADVSKAYLDSQVRALRKHLSKT